MFFFRCILSLTVVFAVSGSPCQRLQDNCSGANVLLQSGKATQKIKRTTEEAPARKHSTSDAEEVTEEETEDLEGQGGDRGPEDQGEEDDFEGQDYVHVQDEATIEFASRVHSVNITSIDYFKLDQSSKLFYYYGRPEWQKTLRCTSDDPNSCEECASQVNCWTSSKNPNLDDRELVLSPPHTYKKFVNTVHVHCVSTYLKVQLHLRKVEKGVLRLFFNGQELSKDNKNAPKFKIKEGSSDADSLSPHTGPAEDAILTFMLKLDSKGGHEFRIEFTPIGQSTDRGVVARFEGLRFFMDNSFMQCEDDKVCLKTLGTNGQAGLTLRQSNLLQLQCLTRGPIVLPCGAADVCCKWRECLEKGQGFHDQRVLMLLKAAGVAGSGQTSKKSTGLLQSAENARIAGSFGDSASQNGSKGSPPPTSSTTLCRNPPTEDPESWECDCFKTIEQACTGISMNKGWSMLTCTTAVFCLNADVCVAWKAVACQDKATKQHMTWLTQSSGASTTKKALLEHAHAGQQRDLSLLNEAAGAKSCQ